MEPKLAHKERTDSCAVPAASIIGESMLAIVLADALLEKFGGDSIKQLKNTLKAVENTNQLYLIGMMGSGKSSTAKALSLSLGWNFIDIDDELTKSFDMSINELFLRGEENFRKLEFAELQKHILKENTVIAVGGGAVSHKIVTNC